MTVYNNELIIAGYFYGIGDTVCHNIAAWDGKVWHPLGKGTRGSWSPYVGNITGLGVYKNELYAGGEFDTAGTVYCNSIAKWNGYAWDSLADNHLCGDPYSMVVHDSNLYIGGFIAGGGGTCTVNGVSRWDGNKLHDLNFEAAGNGTVYSLVWFNGELYAVGSFDVVNGDYSIQSIARSVIATGITSTTKDDPSFQIYPNPAQDEVMVSFPFSNNIITIYDLCGREVNAFQHKKWKYCAAKYFFTARRSLCG